MVTVLLAIAPSVPCMINKAASTNPVTQHQFRATGSVNAGFILLASVLGVRTVVGFEHGEFESDQVATGKQCLIRLLQRSERRARIVAVRSWVATRSLNRPTQSGSAAASHQR